MDTCKGTFIVLRLLISFLVRKVRKLGHNTIWFQNRISYSSIFGLCEGNKQLVAQKQSRLFADDKHLDYDIN